MDRSRPAFWLILLFLLGACTTQKNTLITRSYHNLTSRYNIYFNGIESYKRGVKKLRRTHQDDFSRILPVFPAMDNSTLGSIGMDMERSIRKASKVISQHSLTVKPRRKEGQLTQKERDFYNRPEYNRWIDDAYLLMGKSQFFKMEYFQAINTLRHIIQKYEDPEVKTEAALWLSRIYLEMGNYREAARALDLFGNERNVPSGLRSYLNACYADYHIRQGQYRQAVPRLETALSLASGKTDRSRYSFILGQLHSELGNGREATRYYNAVIKMNPSYEFVFNARVNKAGTFEVATGDAREVRKQLYRMLRDQKNLEFRDQIYYALGNIAFREGNPEEAVRLYIESAAASMNNPAQKGISFLTVADIYFNNEDYRQSQMFYDSAVIFLSNSYPGYESISNKSGHLTELVSYIETVEREDSLQRIAGMSQAERDILIDRIIQKVREEEWEQIRQRQEMQTNTMLFYQSEARFRDDINREGGWYFYNQTARNFGQNEFRRKWGDRKLEDDWRRKNKAIAGFETPASADMPGNIPSGNGFVNQNDIKNREYYLKHLPLNDSLMKRSNGLIMEALFNLGQAYREDFRDLSRARESFEDLNKRYPGNERELSSYVNLFEICDEEENQVMADYYKGLIISKYPDSEYARIISDPGYLERLREEGKKAENHYQAAYSSYQQGDYRQVIDLAGAAPGLFPGHELLPRFIYLKALAEGRQSDPNHLKMLLEEVISIYPAHEVSAEAKRIVEAIREFNPDIRMKEEESIAAEIFAFAENQQHLVAIVLPRRQNTSQFVFNIINFNIEYFTNDNLEAKEEELDSQQKIITVGVFANRKAASSYLDRFGDDPMILKDVSIDTGQMFLISTANYPVLLKDKSLSRYLLFYKKQYLR